MKNLVVQFLLMMIFHLELGFGMRMLKVSILHFNNICTIDFQWHTNWGEQHGRNSFKRAFELWNDRPQIMDLQEVKKLESFNPYSVVYNLID